MVSPPRKKKKTHVAVDLVRDKLGTFVNKAAVDGERFVVTRHGLPAAALVSIDDLKTLESLEVA